VRLLVPDEVGVSVGTEEAVAVEVETPGVRVGLGVNEAVRDGV